MSYASDNISLVRSNADSVAFDGGLISENTTKSYCNLFFPYIQDHGGNLKNVSLTISILNDTPIPDNVVNKKWAKENRLRDGLDIYGVNWGFKEASHSTKRSKSLSNAICFGGQKLSFYIEPQGDGEGYIDGEWVYCKTTLSVTCLDISSNLYTTLYTFDDFTKSKDDSSRYFEYIVGNPAANLFPTYGLYGVTIFGLFITYTYYKGAERRVLLNKQYPNKNQSCLQLLTYSPPKEINEVNAGECNILTSNCASTDTMVDIFNDHSIFSSLEPLNQNSLADDQKRAIIADQIACLFISQHPAITADNYPSKVIGFGATRSLIWPLK